MRRPASNKAGTETSSFPKGRQKSRPALRPSCAPTLATGQQSHPSETKLRSPSKRAGLAGPAGDQSRADHKRPPPRDTPGLFLLGGGALLGTGDASPALSLDVNAKDWLFLETGNYPAIILRE